MLNTTQWISANVAQDAKSPLDELCELCSAQGDGAGGVRRQGGAGEVAATAGRGQNGHQGNNIQSRLRSDELVWFLILILWPLTPQLQAWWRGCMVRRGIGSFKKAEEDKKGKKKKKEGKKKKKKWIYSLETFK